MTDDFMDGVEFPPNTPLQESAMDGFNDGTCWALDNDAGAPMEKYFRPPCRLFWRRRRAYIAEFWEGASE